MWLVYNRADSSESDTALVTTSHVSYCYIPSIIQTYLRGVGEQNEQSRPTGYSVWLMNQENIDGFEGKFSFVKNIIAHL